MHVEHNNIANTSKSQTGRHYSRFRLALLLETQQSDGKFQKTGNVNKLLNWCQKIYYIKVKQLLIPSLLKLLGNTQSGGGGYFGVKRIGMTVGNPRKLS